MRHKIEIASHAFQTSYRQSGCSFVYMFTSSQTELFVVLEQPKLSLLACVTRVCSVYSPTSLSVSLPFRPSLFCLLSPSFVCVCVYVCVCMCVCVDAHICTYVWSFLLVCMCVLMHIYVHVLGPFSSCVCVCVDAHLSTCVWSFLLMCMWMHIYVHVFGDQRTNSGVVPQVSLTPFLRRGLSWSWAGTHRVF